MKMTQYEFSKVSNSIRISVLPVYMEEYSRPWEEHYVWAYTVKIKNISSASVVLLHKSWNVVDMFGTKDEVHGSSGSDQHSIAPGKSYEYTSTAFLHAPSGIMHGKCVFMNEETSDVFYADTPAFSLDSLHYTQEPN